jgi:hypothetical protein
VKLFPLIINKALGDEVEWGNGCIAPPFLTSAPDRDGQLHVPVRLRFRYPLIGGWMGSNAGLDTVEKRKISIPNPDFSIAEP